MKNTLFNFIKKFDLSGEGVLAVAVSGGADSMALVLLLDEWAKQNNKKIIAITVDHGLREESAAEAEQVGKWLQSYNIEHHILKWENEGKKSNIQAAARDARYKLMADFCLENGIASLFVAHNKEDQAETVLLRLMRGSGVDGLSGISDEVMKNGVRVLRPLLDVEKEDLRVFLREKGQEWINDPSNLDEKYARVVVRKFIENSDDPQLLVSRLVDTASNMSRSRDYIESKVKEDALGVIDKKPEGFIVLDVQKFKKLHVEAGLRILSAAIKAVGGEYYKPRFEKLEGLYKNILKDDFDGQTLGGCEIYKSDKKSEAGKLYIVREVSAVKNDVGIEKGKELIWDGRFSCFLNEECEDGVKIGALGESGYRRLCKENKGFEWGNLPKKVVYSLPCLKKVENVLAVPHIKLYPDDGYKKFKAIFIG